MNIVNIIVTGYIIFSISKKISSNFVIILSIITLFLSIEFVYLIQFYRSIDQAKEFYYSSFILTIFTIFYLGLKNNGMNLLRAIFKTLFMVYILMFLIVIIELLTNYHLPASRGFVDDGFHQVPTAFFYNPNDFATIVVLFLPIMHFLNNYLGQNKFKIIMVLSLFFVVITMSRLALLLLVLYPVFYYFIRGRFLTVGFVTITILLSFFLFSKYLSSYSGNDENLLERNKNKFATVVNFSSKSDTKVIAESNTIQKNIRFDVYKAILKNPANFITGKGFVASEPLYQQKIIPIMNPHSYWAEVIFDFGFIGFLPILIIVLIPLGYSFFHNKKHFFYRFAFIQIIYFILLLNIPSSVFCLPIIWIPLAFIYGILFNTSTLFEADNKVINMPKILIAK